MAVTAKGNSYQAAFMVAGERHRKQFPTKVEAEAWELQGRAALKLGKPVPDGGRSAVGSDARTLAGVLRSAETLHWGRLKGSSRTALNASIFVEWAGPKLAPTEAFTLTKVMAFVKYLIEERRVSNSTLNRYMSAISVLIRIAQVPRPELPWFKAGKARVRFFSVEEEHAVITLLMQWDQHDWRDLFIFLCDTGLRPWAECTSAVWSQIGERKISVLGKSGQWRDVPLTLRAQAVLKRRPRDQDGPFTGLAAKAASDLWARVTTIMPVLSDTVWYTCRHTFASRMVQEGVSISRVARLMDNSAKIVDEVYSHLAPDHLEGAVSTLEKFGLRD